MSATLVSSLNFPSRPEIFYWASTPSLLSQFLGEMIEEGNRYFFHVETAGWQQAFPARGCGVFLYNAINI
jgi:hypothetical protein